MTSSTRLVVNTIAQNVRTIINIVLSLYSTRIAMQALGMSDYGIYMLVAGLVSLLSYVSNTLIVTTQRFLSYSAGANDKPAMKKIFANSYIIHWFIGLLLAFTFAALTSWIFDEHILNIPETKIEESKIVYLLVIAAVLITLITAPFRALLISHENIVYISIVDVLDGVLKLVLVILLLFIDSWKLLLYALIMTGVLAFNLVMLAGYCRLHYDESSLIPRFNLWNSKLCQELVGFATWTVYSMACVYVRTQGVAVILNRTLGTIANAAYGVAIQVFGSIQFLSLAIRNAISPQIIKAEGNHQRTRAMYLSLLASKYCYLILALAVIPVVAEMPLLLRIWLGNVPNNAIIFCRMMLIAALCDQSTIGLGILNQATGRIRNYTISVFSIKMLALPVTCFFLYNGGSIFYVAITYVVSELLSAVVRLIYLIYTTELSITSYIRNVFIRLCPATLCMSLTAYMTTSFILPESWRFLITGLTTTIIGIISIWFTATDANERTRIQNIFLSKLVHEKN